MPDVRFDFKGEVNRAYLDFPQLRENTGFVDFSDPSRTIIRPEGNYTAKKSVKRNLKKIGNCVAEANSASGEKLQLVAFFPKKVLKANNETVDKFFTFDHEVGHCLIDGASSIFHENAADAFAAIRCLQRFGNPEYVTMRSVARSLYLMEHADWTHLSSPLLNQIVTDSQYTSFASLTPEETIQKARAYAAQFTPTGNDLAAFNGMRATYLSPFLPKKLSIKFQSWKAFRRPGPLGTEVGASLIRPFLTPEGADFMGKRVKFSPKEQAKLQKRLQKSLAGLS